MSITAASLIARIAVDGAESAEAKLLGVGSVAETTGQQLSKLVLGGVLIAGAALIGLGVASVKAAADFQQIMLQSEALANVSKKDADAASAAILKMATAMGQTPQELGKGFYYIASTGASAKDSLIELALAAKAAAVGNTTTEVTANALTAILSTYGLKAKDAAKITDEMVASVSAGKTEFTDYAKVIGVIATNAKQAGVSFAEATSAFSSLSNVMSPKQAKDAADALLQTSSRFTVLESRAKSLGLAFDLNAYKSMNLEDRLKYLQKITGGNAEEIGKLIGRQNAMAAFTDLSANHFEMYNTVLQSVMHSHGDLDAAFAKTSSGFNAAMGRLNAAGQVLLITIGNQLLPALTKLADAVTPLVSQFTDWVVQNHIVENSLAAVGTAIANVVGFFQTTLAISSSVVQFFKDNQAAAAALGIAIGALSGVMALFVASSMADMILSLLDFGLSILTAVAESVTGAAVMTSTFTTMSGMIIASMGAAAASILATLGPFLLAGAVIAAVSIGIVLAIQHWGEISAWLQATWSNVINWFNGAIATVGQAIQSVINWFVQWKAPIEGVAETLLFFFGPALVIAGAQAAASGAVITATFIASLVQTGVAATVNGLKITATFVASMWEAAIAASESGIAIVSRFVASMFTAGLAAIVSSAQITGRFVVSLFAAGTAAWVAAAQSLPLIEAFIASGVQSAIAGLIIAGKFVVSVVQSGTEAVIAGGKITTSFVASLIQSAREAEISAATIKSTIIPALASTGAAATGAAGVIGVAGAVIIAAIAGWTEHARLMSKNWSNDTNQMQRSSEINFYNIKSGAVAKFQDMRNQTANISDDMKTHVTKSFTQMQTDAPLATQVMSSRVQHGFTQMVDGAKQSTHTMRQDAISDFNSMSFWVRHDSGEMTDTAKRIFGKLVKDVSGDFSTLEQNTKDYWNAIADYIDNKSGLAAAAAQRHFDSIHMPNLTGGQFGKIEHLNASDNTAGGNAEGTDNWRGGLSWVGEKGPELLNIPSGAQIIPNNKIGSVGSAPVIHNHIDVYLDGSRMTGQLMPRIVQQIRTATGVKI